MTGCSAGLKRTSPFFSCFETCRTTKESRKPSIQCKCKELQPCLNVPTWFSSELRHLWGDLTAAPSTYGVVSQKTVPEVLRQYMVGTWETRVRNWIQRFQLDIRRQFSMKTVRHWIRLPSKAVQSLSLEIFKTDWTQPWATCSELTDKPVVSRGLE